jgi:hypothetical protein
MSFRSPVGIVRERLRVRELDPFDLSTIDRSLIDVGPIDMRKGR